MGRTCSWIMLVALLACTAPVTISNDGPRTAISRVAVGSAFALRVGEVAEVAETGVRVRFDGVRQDSRCPSGVQCVWSGDAEVALRITTAAGSTDVLLHTNIDPRTANVAGHVLRLEELRPYPAQTSTIPASEYVVSLMVTAP